MKNALLTTLSFDGVVLSNFQVAFEGVGRISNKPSERSRLDREISGSFRICITSIILYVYR